MDIKDLEMQKFINSAVRIANLSEIYIQRMEYDSNGFIVYMGFALPGSSEDDLVWQIRKCTNNSMGLQTAVNFASSDNSFKYSWTQRGSYTYG